MSALSGLQDAVFSRARFFLYENEATLILRVVTISLEEFFFFSRAAELCCFISFGCRLLIVDCLDVTTFMIYDGGERCVASSWRILAVKLKAIIFWIFQYSVRCWWIYRLWFIWICKLYRVLRSRPNANCLTVNYYVIHLKNFCCLVSAVLVSRNLHIRTSYRFLHYQRTKWQDLRIL